MPVGENAESRARQAIDAQDPKQGQEMQQVQALQSSIQEIQGERNNNLTAARMGAEGDARENQAMLQAAELEMLGGAAGGAGVAIENATPVQQTSPQTQALLSKYGVGKPKNQTTTTRNVQVTPQKITINNNTTNNTTNNIAVPPSNVGGPVQGRTLAIKQQSDQGQARFKTWISNAFARQNQAAAQREKEYQRREWSLSRTTGKLMKKLQELGTTISERMDPRKIASSATNHFKTLLFLFGTMFLAKNWERVIRIGSNIEKFFFGEVDPKNPEGKRGEPGWKVFAKSLFGAKENETVGDAIKHFFSNKEKNGVFDMLMDKVKNFFKERADAAKAIKFPDIDLKDIPGTLKGIAGYIGDILKAIVGGSDAVKDSIGNSINRSSLKSEKDFGYQNNIGYKVENSVGFGSNTSYGDKVLTEAKDGKTAVHLLPGAVDSDGNLTNKASSSISQSNSLAYSSYNNAKYGYYDVAKVSAGLSRLNKSIEDNGKIPVSEEFLKEYLTADQIKSLKSNKNIVYGDFKYWKREKTKEELSREGAGDFLETAGTSYIIDEVTGGNKFGVKAGKAIASRDADYLLGNEVMALKRGAIAKINQWSADKYTYELVPIDAKVPGEKNKDGKVIAYKYPVIDKTVLDTIRKNIGGNGNTYDLGDKDYTTSVQKYLESKYDGGPKMRILDPETGKPVESPYDMNIEKTYKELDNIKKESERRNKELDKKYESSPLKRSGDYIKNEIINPVKDWITGSSEDHKNHAAIAITKEEQIKNAKSAMDFFISKGFTTEQAAGIVGVLHAESGLDPGIVNEQEKKDGKSGYGRGIAQWSNERIKEFGNWYKSKYGEYKEPQETDFATQLEYVWKEMQDRLAFMKAIKSTNDIVEATDYMLRGFENGSTDSLASPENIDSTYLKKAGRKQAYDSMMAERVPRAKGIYELYTGKSSENSGDEKQKIPEDQQDATTQPDASGTYITQNTLENPKVTEYGVEYNGQTYNPEFAQNLGLDLGKFGASGDALYMAQNSTPVAPTSVKQVSGGVPGSSSSSSYTTRAAEKMVASTEKGSTDNLLTNINNKLSTLNTLTAEASDQQVQATMTIAQAIGNMKININNQGSPQVVSGSYTGTPWENYG